MNGRQGPSYCKVRTLKKVTETIVAIKMMLLKIFGLQYANTLLQGHSLTCS